MWFASCMGYTIKAVTVLALVFLAGGVMAGGNKGKKVDISFHIETEAANNPKMIFPHDVMGKQRFFRRIPEVSSNDYIAFTPFPADDQASYGAILQLKDNVGRRLAAVTQSSSGKWLVCKAFGRIVDSVLIEGAVEDAVLVIWKGLTLEEIQQMDESIPRIGEKKK